MAATYNEAGRLYNEAGLDYSGESTISVRVLASLTGNITSVCGGHDCQAAGTECMDIDDNASSTVTYAATVLDRHTMLEISSRGLVTDVRVSCEFSTEGAAGDAVTVDVQIENGPSWKTVGQIVYSHVDSSVAEDDVLENDDDVGTVFQGPRAHDSCWMGLHLHQGWDASSPETTVAACESASSPVTANSTVVGTLE